MMYLVTYPCRNSNTGEGISIVSADNLAEFAERYNILTCTEYVREECHIFTPAVVAACIGNNPSN